MEALALILFVSASFFPSSIQRNKIEIIHDPLDTQFCQFPYYSVQGSLVIFGGICKNCLPNSTAGPEIWYLCMHGGASASPVSEKVQFAKRMEVQKWRRRGISYSQSSNLRTFCGQNKKMRACANFDQFDLWYGIEGPEITSWARGMEELPDSSERTICNFLHLSHPSLNPPRIPILSSGKVPATFRESWTS